MRYQRDRDWTNAMMSCRFCEATFREDVEHECEALLRYRERAAVQLDSWVVGRSIHNEIDDECCPDFSCCNPAIRIAIGEKQAFKAASPRDRERMLVFFLQRVVGDDVYVAGESEVPS